MERRQGGILCSERPAASHRLLVATQEQLEDYRALTAEILEIDFPLDYLARSQVLVFVDHRGSVRGGATVVLDPPFRSVESVPAAARRQLQTALDGESLAEINGVWLARDRQGWLASLLFWRSLLEHVLSTGRRQFVFSFPLRRRDLPATYRLAQPRILYTGLTEPLPGTRNRTRETIAVVQSPSLSDVLATFDDWFGGMH